MTLHKDPVIVKIVEDDESVQSALSDILTRQDYRVESYLSASDFNSKESFQDRTIYIVDVRLGPYNGMDLVQSILHRNPLDIVLVMSSFGGFEAGAEAIKKGAFDVIEKPFSNDIFMQKIESASQELKRRSHEQKSFTRYEDAMHRLSIGEKKVFEFLLKGTANKVIAAELKVSLRTIELRRAKLLKNFGVGSLAELVSLHCMIAKATPNFVARVPDFFQEVPSKGVM